MATSDTHRGGATPSSTRCTRAASPTATATVSATWRASGPACRHLRRPRRRRDLDQPLVPVADGRRRLRRRRLPRHRPGLRHAGRGRGADRRGARAGHPDHRRHRAEPRLQTSTRGSRRRWPPARTRRSGSCFWFRPGTGPDGRDAAPTGAASSAARPGPGSPTGRHPASGTCTCSTPQQPDLNWDHPDVRSRVRRRPAVLVRPRRGRHPDRLGRAAAQGPGAARGAWTGKPHPFHDLDEVHDIYRAWRRIADEYRRPGADRRGVDARGPERFANYLRPDELHTAFNFDFLGCAWDAELLRAVHRRTLHAHAAGRRARPPGCCPTTTSPGTSPATAARTPRSASPANARRHPGRPGARHPPGPGRRRCWRSRCPAPPTSTRARSWACGRSRTSRASCAQDPMWHRRRRDPAGTAAGCRCRGRAASRRSASARPTRPPSRGCRSRRRGRTCTVAGADRRPALDARALPRGARACAAASPACATPR